MNQLSTRVHLFRHPTLLLFILIALVACSTSSNKAVATNQKKIAQELDSQMVCREPAAAESEIYLVPQENYGKTLLGLLGSVDSTTPFIQILHFNFFTDNPGDSLPKAVLAQLKDIRKKFPMVSIRVGMESRHDLDKPRGAAARNAKTRKVLLDAGIAVFDVHGLPAQEQSPPGREDGVTHTKLAQVGRWVLAGSTNLTKQSTDPGANNEMNLLIGIEEISAQTKRYFEDVTASPGKMANLTASAQGVRLLGDQLHFEELLRQIKLADAGDMLALSMYQFLYRSERDTQAREVFEALIEAHRDRGVEVEVYLNRAELLSEQNTEANIRVAEMLLEKGIRGVYFDIPGKISHSKFLIRVGKEGRPAKNGNAALVSSVNIYHGDFNNNHQLSWVIENPEVITQLFAYFKHQIAYDSSPLEMIPVDPRTGLRYQLQQEGNQDGRQEEKIVWNKPMPAKTMMRFWRGFRQDNVPSEIFEQNVNQRLVPETIVVGESRGLAAYQPSFLPRLKPNFLPDEIALVYYGDIHQNSNSGANLYNAIRTTERGAKYGPLHMEDGLFTRKNNAGYSSGSLVTVPYSGKVDVDLATTAIAYSLGPDNLNWQQGTSVRATLILKPPLTKERAEAFLNFIEKEAATERLRGAAVLIDPQYILLMGNVSTTAKANAFIDNLKTNASSFQLGDFFESVTFRRQQYGQTKLAEGQGINVIFDSKVAADSKLRTTLLAPLQAKVEQATRSRKAQESNAEVVPGLTNHQGRSPSGPRCHALFNP